MGMNLYVQSGAVDELRAMAKDGELLGALGALRGLSRSDAIEAVKDAAANMALDESTFENGYRQYEEQVRRQGFFARIWHRLFGAGLRDDFRRVHDLMNAQKAQLEALDEAHDWDDEESATMLDLHKSWHILHYLFTGSADSGRAPGNLLMEGGETVGGDLGYGPARVLDAQTTARFAAFLEGIDVETLKARLDLERMAALQIYCVPDEPDEGDAIEIEEDVDLYFPQLQDYVRAAAAKGEALAIWMA